MTSIETTVSELSIDFDDYTAEARAKYDGTHLFVGVHVPIEQAKSLTLGTPMTVTFGEVRP